MNDQKEIKNSKDADGLLDWNIPTKIYNVKDGCIEQLIARLYDEKDIIFSRMPDVDTLGKYNLLLREHETLKSEYETLKFKLYSQPNNENINKKTCSHCNELKSISEFNSNKTTKDGLQCWCKKCQSRAWGKHYQKQKLKNILESGMKKCPRCGNTKSINEFHKDLTKKDGHHSCCKVCANTYQQLRNTKKLCPHCNELKSRSNFNKSKSHKDGLQYYCRSCQKQFITNFRHKKNNIAPILETEHKVIVETYEPRSEMKISNGLDPNAIPVIDSNSVIENKANDKLHKNWFKFRIKGSR